MITSEQINEIAAALSKAQGAMRPAIKDAQNPHFRSRYADLAANVEAARTPLAANGLAVIQEATTTERGVAVATRLLHSSGQWIQFDPITVPMTKQDAHGVGSAVTYARRYALGAALGLVADDDDGTAAVNGSRQQTRPVAVPPPTTSEPAKVATADDMPPGFVQFVEDLEAVADEGSPALKTTWTKSRADLRKHLTTYYPEQWEAIKARAEKAKVTA